MKNVHKLDLALKTSIDEIQKCIDKFYKKNGPCCAGCDWWGWYNSLVGECIKSAPVGGKERYSMLDIQFSPSANLEAGHIITTRDHYCGDFKDDGKEGV